MITPLMSRTGALSQSSTEYMGLMLHNQDANITENRSNFVMPVAGFLGGLRVVLVTAPGSGDSYTFTVRKNGIDTSLSVTISDTNTAAENYSDILSFVAGDLFNIKITPSGTPASTECRFYILISADSAVLLCNEGDVSGGLGATTEHSLSVMGTVTNGITVGVNGVQEDGGMVCPSDGAITTMYVQLSAAPGVGDTRVFTLYVNDVATSLIVNISETNTAGNTTTLPISIASGDKLYVLAETPTLLQTSYFSIGMDFIPNTPDEVPYMSACLQDPSGTQYQYVSSDIFVSSASEGSLSPGVSVTDMYVWLQNSAGVGESRTITLVKNGTDTATTLTLSDTSNAGIFVGSVSYSDNDVIDYKLTESSTSAADPVNVRIGIKSYFTGRNPFPFAKPMRFYSLSSGDPFIFHSRTQ